MATTSGPFTPSLLALITAPDPTAQWGSPATKVQVQNASPFALTVTVNGEQNTITSFTAQTLDTGGTGASATILPTAGPAGSQGSVTMVWLITDQAPPMTDGQLTGAATYAQGLGSTLLPATILASASLTPLSIPPTVRTLVFTLSSTTAVTNITVTGTTSGFAYYQGTPYLKNLSSFTYTVVVPVNPVVDPTVNLFVQNGGATTITTGVAGDTAAYDESLFYNGSPTTVTASTGPTTLATGPLRLLNAHIDVQAAQANIITVGGKGVLRADGSNQPGTVALSFPQPWCVGPGVIVATTGASTESGVSVAYP